MKLRDKILILLFVSGMFLRLYDLGRIPSGLYLDETQYGLDAYSILKTGKDVYGHFMPLAFQSSGYYPPLYTYTLVPFLYLFNLSAWAVRLPAVFSGILTVFFLFLLSKKLIKDEESYVPYIATFLISFSWLHIHLSRVAFLGSFGVIFLLSGSYFFLKGLASGKYFFISCILFGLSTFAHYGYQLISPAIFVCLILIYRKYVSKSFNLLFIFIWFFIMTLNIIAHFKYNAAFRVNELATSNLILVIKEYFGTFSFKFLFILGDHYKLNNPFNKGVLPLSLLPFLIIGLFKLVGLKKQGLFILGYLLIVPIPSALGGLGQHAVRNSALLIPLFFVSALGVEYFFKFKYFRILFYLIFVFFICETFFSLKYYFSDYAKDSSFLWGNSQRQAIHFASSNSNEYENIIFTDYYNVMLTYWAFEKNVNPQEVQEAITKPELFQLVPSKNLHGTHFLSLEQGIDKYFVKTIRGKNLVIDTTNYFIDNRFKQFDMEITNSFRYLEIK